MPRPPILRMTQEQWTGRLFDGDSECVAPGLHQRRILERAIVSLIDHCRPHLARFMLPRYIRFMPELPHTPADKVAEFTLVRVGVTAHTWGRQCGGTATVSNPQGVQ